MSTGLALSLLILVIASMIIGIGTALESWPKKRKIQNKVNSEMVRLALKKKYKK